MITSGGNLSAKYVIHTVGPVWNEGKNNEKTLLQNCYLNSLKLAQEYECKSLAFPNISTGIYKFPKELAAQIAIEIVKKNPLIEEVTFVCFDNENYEIYRKLLD